MKKTFQILTLMLLLIAILTTCKKEPVNGVFLESAEQTVMVGQTATLTVTFIPKNATNKKVNWESSDPKVATVENGIVTGIALGESKISVTSQDSGRKAHARLYVIQPIEPGEMIWVEGGTFTMGCTDEQGEDCFDNEIPAHQVTLNGFYISKYVVTQKEWTAAMVINRAFPESIGDSFPANRISWDEINEYIFRLNDYTGKKYRLPTEAEWEYAARGGNKSNGYKYSGSNYVDAVAWYHQNSDHKMNRVGQKMPNELGIYDMSGNISEECSDWFEEYTNVHQTNPIGPESGTHRIIRGGSWNSWLARYVRLSNRDLWNATSIDGGTIGFRLVLDKK